MIKKLLICIGLISVGFTTAYANSSLWTFSSEKVMKVPGERKIIPNEYQLVKLNTNDFQIQQAFIPTENSGQTTSISLPTPDGQMMTFRIFECPMMEAPLAAKYPMIKTYTAIADKDARITAKIDFTVFGFHAKVFDGDQTYFIDPYTDVLTDWYIVYYKHDYTKPLQHRMACMVDEAQHLQEGAMSTTVPELPSLANKQNGANKLTYRLALACTVEYSAAVGGATPTKASVLSAMVTSMNRVNGVFERDLSMHANLVAKNDTLIYIGTTDPYTNNNGSTMLNQNQTTINTRIGSANYDYGHVFSTGGGGIASLACVCSSNSKAQGVTGSPSPVGDPYDIDYVAHEMGHQFGGEHTFNSGLGSCSGNRSSTSAFEPGSATTIMGYAGICSTDDIQAHSDDYYHVRSLEQMTGTSVTACAAKVPSNNTYPTLAPIANTLIIPYKTSFELEAFGTDADGNPLTYCWEEYDRGGNSASWDAATTVAPILRSFSPKASGLRVFPQMSKLLINTVSYMGERLPDTNRIVRFRCTLRDINNGYGAFTSSTDTFKLDVRKTTSLFRVTSHNTTGTTLNAYAQENIIWDVAGTNASPINTGNVNIYLTVDSAKTWILLKGNTPNDGNEMVIIPTGYTSAWCRFKVKAVDNVYFDLNDKWFGIKSAPTSVSQVEVNPIQLFPNPASQTVQVTGNFELSDNYSITDVQGRIILSGNMGSTNQTIDIQTLDAGVYMFQVIKKDGKVSQQKFIKQ